ncbi:MAG: AI-2E family transporter [Nitrospirales bacterium]|nr:MAG: AI-2E family transporter [Nitrospirales bacterium]
MNRTPVYVISTLPSTDMKPARNIHLWEIVAIRELCILAMGVFLLWLCFHLQAILVPIFIGLGLAYLTEPVLDYVEQTWKLPRWLAVTLMAMIICALVSGFFLWVGPNLVEQLRLFIEKVPTYLSLLADRHGIDVDKVSRHFKEVSTNIRENPLSTLKTFLTGTGQVFYFTNLIIGTLGSFLFSFSLIIIYFFFFAWSFPSIQHTVWSVVESQEEDRWPELLTKMDQAIGEFFRGRLLIALMMSVMFAIGWFWVGMPYWILLGLGAGLLSLVPYAATLIWPVAILLKYLDMSMGSGSTDNYWMQLLVWPSAVYLGVQFLEGWVLTPWIQSQSTDLSAATILLVVLIGGALGGVLGLILAIPFAACLKILAKELIIPRIKRGNITEVHNEIHTP